MKENVLCDDAHSITMEDPLARGLSNVETAQIAINPSCEAASRRTPKN